MTNEISASHILCSIEKTNKKEALKSIKEIQKKLSKGAEFSVLAEKFSDCPSCAKGGDLGSFGRGVMVDEFEDAVFALEKDEISKIVETEFGYHLIYRTG